ncbi:hypothetical protein MLD38_021332 [Melastoma candidum]|uniref:Uncharacterized protein n=1 Tax=Melastoma candidum TaxID=119954 RepID=A0ACB9QFN3_9MYRT|nr:hypothetical protein MLD38_021332 [Melastoma candidum]
MFFSISYHATFTKEEIRFLQSMVSWKLVLSLLVVCIGSTNAETEVKTYIVHMDQLKVVSVNGDPANPVQYYQSMLQRVKEFGGSSSSAKLLHTYQTVLSGFSAKLSSKQLELVKGLDGFISAVEDELLGLHTTRTPQFLGLENGEGLWGSEFLSSDVIIGVLDSGIWPEHPSFVDEGMSPVPSKWKGACEEGTNFTASNCNNKLIGARSFFKGYEEIVGRISETSDYKSARDRQGHGTHTSSTVGGNLVKKASLFGLAKGSASGMRYTARIAAYKVCWRLGCASSDILAAIDVAVADGVDVLSLSLGGLSRPYYLDNIAIAAFGAFKHGVLVICSAGNSGPLSSTVSNAAPWIMTVAASYLDRSFPTKATLADGRTFRGSSLYVGKAVHRAPLVYKETAGTTGSEFCIPGTLNPKLVSGKIVVCERGLNGRTSKGEQVKIAGGVGMLILNTDEEGTADAHVLPTSSLGASSAFSIRKYLNSTNNPRASLSFGGTSYGNKAPVMAAFSSRGPSSAGPDVIKPDVTAPGVNILAAWPPTIGPSLLTTDNRRVLFNIISGTSMSCPHVSGLASLLMAAHHEWSPAAIKSALMTTAYTLDNKMAPISDIASGFAPATPFEFGSGHVDPERASDPGLIYDLSTDDYLIYLCSLKYNATQISLFAGMNYTCQEDKVAEARPFNLNYPSFAVLLQKGNRTSNVSLTYLRTVTNVGKHRSTYRVVVKEPEGVSLTVKPRVMRFQKRGEKQSYEITFAAQHSNGSNVRVHRVDLGEVQR